MADIVSTDRSSLVALSSDGVAWNQNFCGAKATQLEVYLDLQCPDSRSTWRSLHSVLRQLDESGDQLCFLLYLFPLPYHSNSFLSALAAQVIGDSEDGVAEFFTAVSELFSQQDDFSAPKSTDKSVREMADFFAEVVEKHGVSKTKYYKAVFGGDDLNMNLRASWKLGVTRGVHSTPFFFINRVAASDPDPDWTADDWLHYLNPYLHKSYI